MKLYCTHIYTLEHFCIFFETVPVSSNLVKYVITYLVPFNSCFDTSQSRLSIDKQGLFLTPMSLKKEPLTYKDKPTVVFYTTFRNHFMSKKKLMGIVKHKNIISTYVGCQFSAKKPTKQLEQWLTDTRDRQFYCSYILSAWCCPWDIWDWQTVRRRCLIAVPAWL